MFFVNGDIGLQIIIILVLIIANGLFSMSELAIVNSKKSRLEDKAESGQPGAAVALKLAEDPNQMFSTVQIGITLIGIVTGLYSGAALSQPLADALYPLMPGSLRSYTETISTITIVTVVTYFSLVIGELVPKRLAYNAPETVASIIAPPMYFFSKLMAPAVKVLSVSTDVFLRLLHISDKKDAHVTESEITKMLIEGAELGVFEKEEPVMIDNIFHLADMNASDIMTPRTQLQWIDLNAPVSETIALLQSTQHYRLPVGRDSLDELEGIVLITDVFAEQLAGHGTPLLDVIAASVKAPLMVPESITLMKLLGQFKSEGVHEAVVLDEYGGFSGLVTLHDIMEEIVGFMPAGEEEMTEEENRIVKRSENSWLVDGLIPVDELKEYFSISDALPGEEESLFKTAGGFAVYMFNRIPKESERFTWRAYTFEVIDMDNTRIDKLLVTRLPDISESNYE